MIYERTVDLSLFNSFTEPCWSFPVYSVVNINMNEILLNPSVTNVEPVWCQHITNV